VLAELWRWERQAWNYVGSMDLFEACAVVEIDVAAAVWDRDCEEILSRQLADGFTVKLLAAPTRLGGWGWLPHRAFVGPPARISTATLDVPEVAMLAPSTLHRLLLKRFVAAYCEAHERWDATVGSVTTISHGTRCACATSPGRSRR